MAKNGMGAPAFKEPRELAAACLALAQSQQPDDHARLLSQLQSEEFLKQLDSEKAYLGPPVRLRLRRILEVLSKNPAPSARQALITLTQTPSFYNEPARADLLILAIAEIRPALPEVIKFWDKHSQPDDGFTPLTIEAMVKNGSAPAINLLEEKIADPRHEEEDKLDWMRSSILTHRNDLILLQGCERMISRGLPERLRVALIEVLFDYRPQEWFRPSAVLKAPDRRLASPEALSHLRKIGEIALSMKGLKEALRKKIEETLQEIPEKK